MPTASLIGDLIIAWGKLNYNGLNNNIYSLFSSLFRMSVYPFRAKTGENVSPITNGESLNATVQTASKETIAK